MKYPLDCEENIEKSFLFWICRFIKFKLNSLSNKDVKDHQVLTKVTLNLTKGVQNINELDILVKKARNCGLSGINTYFNPLKKMLEFILLHKPYSLTQIDEEMLVDFLANCTGGLSDATKKNYRIAVISFFKFLDKQNEEDGKSHVFDMSLKQWRGVVGKKAIKLPGFMEEYELERFLKAVDNATFKSFENRNKLIIKMIIYTGMRVSEAIHIKKKDISLNDGFYTIRIRAKGNKYRVVMIKQDLISTYLLRVLEQNRCEDGLVFCNKFGKLITQAYISRIVEQILIQAGIRKEKNGAHMLRHTYATLLYRKKNDIVLVQEALGHASLNTSRIYTHFNHEKLKEAAIVTENFVINTNK